MNKEEFKAKVSGICRIAQGLENCEAADALASLDQKIAEQMTSLFISGAKAEDFTQLLSFTENVAPPLVSLLKDLLGSVKRVKYDNSAVIQKIIKDLKEEQSLTRLEQEKQRHHISALKEQQQLLFQESRNNLLKTLGNIQSVATGLAPKEDNLDLFRDSNTRDIFIQDSAIREQAISANALKINPDGTHEWLI